MKAFYDLKSHFNYNDIEIWGIQLPLCVRDIECFSKELGAVNTSEKKSIGDKRWLEFCTGRLCVIKSSQELLLPITWLSKKESGAPDWPRPLVGSISHSKSYAIAAVTKSDRYLSIGCDIEEVVSHKRIQVIKKMVLVDDEESFVNNEKEAESITATLIFSAKESLYKLINPLGESYLNFHEGIMREIDYDQKTFSIELKSSKKEYLSYCGLYKGHFSLFENNIITIISLEYLAK